MKNARIHLIYLAIIGFWGFQYWTKTQALNEAVGSIEQFDKLLKMDNKVIDMTTSMIFNKIQMNVMAYKNVTNVNFEENARSALYSAHNIRKWLEKQGLEFISISGGFNKKDTTILKNRLAIKPSSQFFSGKKIQEIRDSLTRFNSVLFVVSDQKELKRLQEYYRTTKLLNDFEYWQKLKSKTASEGLAQMTFIQNQMLLDLNPYLNYIFGQVAIGDIKFDDFKVAITPQKAVLLEGETFKADIYLAQYSSNPGSNVSITVNNKEIPFYAGIAHFENKEQIKGLKNIKATAILKNPLTGQIRAYVGEFEYEVLPKCSRDCK